MLANELLQGDQESGPRVDPVDMNRIFCLVGDQNLVGIELTRVGHLLDIRCRCRLDDDPSQSRNGLGNGRQMVKVDARPILLPNLLHLVDRIGQRFDQRLDLSLGRTLVGGGQSDETMLGCDGSVNDFTVNFDQVTDGRTQADVRVEMIVQNVLEGLFRRHGADVGGRSKTELRKKVGFRIDRWIVQRNENK